VHLVDLEQLTVMTSLQAHDGVPCVDFWQTGDFFLTVGHDGFCKVWDTTTRALLASFSSPRRLDQGVWSGSFFSNSKAPGPNFCFAGADGIVHVIKAE
jgi:WD40 repeat protein